MTVQVWLHTMPEQRPKMQRQSAVARQLLAIACQFNNLHLDEEELGRPGLELMDLVKLEYGRYLSISHCQRLVAVTLAENNLGIDCEPSGRARNWLAIAGSFFTRAEADALGCAEPREREALFLKHWVLKESYIKATRGSVFGDLNRLVVEEIDGKLRLNIASATGGPWWAWQGHFGSCLVGICGAGARAPTLEFFHSRDLARGDFARCDELVTGRFLQVT